MVLILDVLGLLEARRARSSPASIPRVEVVTPPRIAARPPELAAPTPARLHVLFVDDSVVVRKVAERTLQSLDVDVTVAVDGVDALAKLREASFDLVFTDLEMPRMHGFELIRELRFRPAFRDLPIVVVTSRSGQKHQDEARALGATEYLTKPFTARTLEAALEKWGPRKRGGA